MDWRRLGASAALARASSAVRPIASCSDARSRSDTKKKLTSSSLVLVFSAASSVAVLFRAARMSALQPVELR